MDNDLPAPNPPATNNVEAYLAMLAGVQGLSMPATINNNVEYYLRYLVEHGGGGGGGIPTTVIDTIWFGTQAQYDAIATKAEKTLYLVQEETTTANTLSASPAVLTVPKINLGNANILNNVVTPEEEIEEPEGEEEKMSEEPQVEEPEVEETEEPQEEEPEVEEQEVVEEPEEEENIESEE
jgi:outer membrane biosynthesis protein TonB